jgi:hypothetical protein
MNVLSTLTAGEMAMAEKTAGLSIATLEDPNFPKVDLLAALAWVYDRRENPKTTFNDFKDSKTLEQIAEEQAADKARFCLATGVAPSEYDNLTQTEINAFIKEANRRSKK